MTQRVKRRDRKSIRARRSQATLMAHYAMHMLSEESRQAADAFRELVSMPDALEFAYTTTIKRTPDDQEKE